MALVFRVQTWETPVIFPCSSARGSRLYAAVIKEGGAQPRIKYCIAFSCRSRSAQVGGLGRKVEQTPCNRRNKRATEEKGLQRSPSLLLWACVSSPLQRAKLRGHRDLVVLEQDDCEQPRVPKRESTK
jgi:hypothetical protein